MSKLRERGEAVRRFILNHLGSEDVVRATAEEFGCTRQAVHLHISRLIKEGAIIPDRPVRAKSWKLAELMVWRKDYAISSAREDRVWYEDIGPILGALPDNVSDIWHYGFTEMFNNALEHSGGATITVVVRKSAIDATIMVADDGGGIFRKIQAAMGLLDERHAVLELAKGKFTTDPRNHTGEGIFFSSRMFDRFIIYSGDVHFSHDYHEPEDWIRQTDISLSGTCVVMRLGSHTSRTARKVFDRFSSVETGFTKTVVPVRLMKYGDDNLVSRSQAKRLLARFDCFRVVVLDFSGVEMIGQGFADEVFRVFRSHHPEVDIRVEHANSVVRRMIAHVVPEVALRK